jgi:uncharacterized protein
MSYALDAIPVFGSGLGYREQIAAEIDAHADQIDVLEVITERYLERRRDELERLSEQFAVIPHGVSLSVGSAGLLEHDHLRRLREVAEITGSPYYSEHLCFTQAPGVDLGHLAPLWFTEPVLKNAIDRVNQVQEEMALPLVLENVTYLFELPNAAMRQAEFFARLVEATGCGILLDVTNVYINSVNHGFDPQAFLDEMPLENVVHVHLAGGYWEDGLMVDGHSHPVPEEAWELLDEVTARTRVRTVILEHDEDFPPSFEPLIAQVGRAREALRRAPAGARG